jgi:hypothetical protein
MVQSIYLPPKARLDAPHFDNSDIGFLSIGLRLVQRAITVHSARKQPFPRALASKFFS